MAKKKPATGEVEDEVEEELDEEELEEETEATDEESETDGEDEAGEEENSDEEEAEEPTVADLQAQLTKMQRALKKANRESAKRRKELETLRKSESANAAATATIGKGKSKWTGQEEDELRKLREQNERLLAEQKRGTARNVLVKAALKAKVNWASEQAREDAFDLILRDAEINDDGSIDDAGDLLAELIEERPYLLGQKMATQKKSGDTSATKRGELRKVNAGDLAKRKAATNRDYSAF